MAEQPDQPANLRLLSLLCLAQGDPSTALRFATSAQTHEPAHKQYQLLVATLALALTVTRTAENVGRELLALSTAKCAEADKIIAEFNIKLNAPPTPDWGAGGTDTRQR